jgi:hypothetical protein
MKVQVPGDRVREWKRRFAAHFGLGDPGSLNDKEVAAFEETVSSVVDYINEQHASKSPFLNDLEVHELGKELRGGVALTTKRPFLSDLEIDEQAESYSNSGRVEKICFCVGARWARDKYEARDGVGVPGVESAQTFYVVKRNEDPRYFDCNEERWRKSVQFCLEDESYLQGVMSNEHNKHLRGARIVKVRVSEVEG